MKKPNLTATKCSQWFPQKINESKIDTNSRNKVTYIIDSINREHRIVIETTKVYLQDTNSIENLKSALVLSNKFIERLKNTIINIPIVKDTIIHSDTARSYALQYSLKDCTKERELIKDKYTNLLKWIVALVIISGISIILNIIKFK